MAEDGRRLVTPSRGDGVAKVATEVIGGPVGRFARSGARSWLYVAAVLSSLASTLIALGVLQKNHCERVGWGGPGAFWRACYSDLPVGVGGSVGSTPWSAGGPGQTQPALTAYLTWALQHLVPAGGTVLHRQQIFYGICAVVITALVAATTIATASMLRDSPWQAAHVALSPVLITASLLSLDILGVALATAGMALWMRRMPLTAGALLGAAVMARSYPLIIIAAIALLALRERRTDAVVRMVGAAAVVITFFLPSAVALGGDPLAPYRAWGAGSASYGSPWLVAAILHVTLPSTALTIVALLGWLAALLAGMTRVSMRHPVRLGPLALMMLVIVMVTGRSFTPQESLWVLPLLAISAMRWREHLAWAMVEIVYFVMVWMYAGSASNPGKALAPAGYAVFCVIRLVAYGGLAFASWESAEDVDEQMRPVVRRPAARTDADFRASRSPA